MADLCVPCYYFSLTVIDALKEALKLGNVSLALVQFSDHFEWS